MSIIELINRQLFYLDGGMGTLLQAAGLAAGEHPEHWNITHPDVVKRIAAANKSIVVNSDSHAKTTVDFGIDNVARAFMSQGISVVASLDEILEITRK